jgi:hypothetical protein
MTFRVGIVPLASASYNGASSGGGFARAPASRAPLTIFD